MTRCEYCGRGAYLSRDHLSCDECGAPLPISYAQPVMMYDQQALAAQQSVFLAQPRQNIPINSQYAGKLSHAFFQGAGSVGLAMVKGFYR